MSSASKAAVLNYKNQEGNKILLSDFFVGKFLFFKGTTEELNAAEKFSQEEIKNIRMLPLKFPFNAEDIKAPGVTQEKLESSLRAFVPAYYCVSSKVSKKEQKLAIDFLHWVSNSNIGKDFVTKKLVKLPFVSDEVVSLENFSSALKTYKNPEDCVYTTNLKVSKIFNNNLEISKFNSFINKSNFNKEDFEQASNIWLTCFKASEK